MATPRYISSTNAFIPEATGQAIAYVRDQSKFKLLKYVQFIKSEKPVGVYAFLDPDAPVRVVTDEEFAWEDGDPAPTGNASLANFKWEEFRCMRRAYPFAIGEQALETATGWNPKAFHNAIVLSQAMTNKTKRVVSMLETQANWGSNTATASSLNDGAGYWDLATGDDDTDPNYLAIKKSILEAVIQIGISTNNMVQMSDLMLVISPGLAKRMAMTGEINAFLKQSPFALGQVRGDAPGQNTLWGLPDHYVLPIVVEDATRAIVRPKASGAVASIPSEKNYIKSNDSAVIVSRVGGLDGNYGSPSFSTVQTYYYKYLLTVEGRQDSWDKRYEGRVVDHFKEVLAAPQAGYLIREVLSE